MTTKKLLVTIGLVAALVAASLFFGYRWGQNSIEPEIVTKTEYRTVTIREPAPTITYNTGKLIFVPIVRDSVQNDTTTHYVPSSDSTATGEAVVVDLPETLVEYCDSAKVDSVNFVHYRIGVKGYQPSLAYADFSWPYTYTKETVVKKKPAVTFGWGLVGGVGYGMINRKPDIFVGVGVSLNFNFRRD